MPRRARIALADVPLHVIQRGNNRQACFFADDDNAYYLDQLKQCAQRAGCAIHAYVLMTNHVHLLLTPRESEAAGRLMKLLGQRYVQHVNRLYRRSGTLWEGRFRSCIVQDEAYLLGCSRYIELNPVRAGMVSHPAEYRWSSYRANAEGEADSLIEAHPAYTALGRQVQERRAAYRREIGDRPLFPEVFSKRIISLASTHATSCAHCACQCSASRHPARQQPPGLFLRG